MDLVFCRDGVDFHPALLSGAVGLMVDFCQFPDAAFGRVDVHCRILGTQMGAARYPECAHPRCGAGVQEHPGAPALIVAARSCLHCRWYHTPPRTASSPGAPMAPSRCTSSWPRSANLPPCFQRGVTCSTCAAIVTVSAWVWRPPSCPAKSACCHPPTRRK